MKHRGHSRTPAELHEVEQRLLDRRPELTALELDAVKRRAMASAARATPSLLTRQKGRLMKSRIAVTAMLAAGLLMSGTGATLAVSGLAGSGSAGTAQYPDRQPAGQPLGQQEAAEPAPTGDVQPVRQVSTTDDAGTLPFTGFLAIPVLIGGVGLLGAGIVLRRRADGGTNDRDGENAA